MGHNIELSLRGLNLQERNAIALACCRELVPILYEREQFVIAKLIETPVELCLEFYKEKSKIFNQVYGFLDPLMFRAQEPLAENGLIECLQSSVEVLLSTCKDIHAYHVEVDGGSGPPYDCYLAEVDEDAPLNSLKYSLNAFSTLKSGNNFDFYNWLANSAKQIKEKSMQSWINSLEALEVDYPFGSYND